MDDARREAAAKAGLAPELAARLQGETAEELAADAAKLAALVRQAEQTTPLAERAAKAEAEGDTATSLALKSQMLAGLHAEEDRANATRYGITHNTQES